MGKITRRIEKVICWNYSHSFLQVSALGGNPAEDLATTGNGVPRLKSEEPSYRLSFTCFFCFGRESW